MKCGRFDEVFVCKHQGQDVEFKHMYNVYCIKNTAEKVKRTKLYIYYYIGGVNHTIIVVIMAFEIVINGLEQKYTWIGQNVLEMMPLDVTKLLVEPGIAVV